MNKTRQILYFFLSANKFNKKTKTNSELMLLMTSLLRQLGTCLLPFYWSRVLLHLCSFMRILLSSIWISLSILTLPSKPTD